MAKYIKGIDVAHWEPEVDWEKVRAQDIRFAFIKATQADFADGMFNSHWAGAKRAGVLRGAYHFIDPRVSGRIQAETFLRTVKLEPGDLPPVLDLEDLPVEMLGEVKEKKGRKGGKEEKGGKGGKGGKGAKQAASGLSTNAQMSSCVEEWLRIVEAETGRKPIIYSGPFFLRDRMCGPNGVPPAWGKNYTLWIANYLDHEITDQDLPLQPKGWADWSFWQYSETGLVDGIFNPERTQLTAVDLNFFRGTLEELYALAGVSMIDGAVTDMPKVDVVQKVDDGEIVIPPVDEPAPVPTMTPGVIQHLIAPGDTLFALAIKHRTTVDAILALNPQITNPNLIRVGDRLNIPQGG